MIVRRLRYTLDVRMSYGRAVVTGLGAVSGHGWGTAPLWAGLRDGRTAIGPIRRFDPSAHRTRVAAEVPPPPVHLAARLAEARHGPPSDTRHATLTDLFAIAAADEALRQAGLLGGGGGGAGCRPLACDPHRAGVFFGSSTGGFWESEQFFEALIGPRRVPVRIGLLPGQPCSAPAEAVARRAAVRGRVETISSACASGTLALGAALDAIRAGEIDVALVGGADSFCRLTHAGFNALRSVDPNPCRPFRADREGLSIGEGSAILVVEDEDHARARGATALAVLAGCGASCDAGHMTAPDATGEGPARAIEAALGDAGVGPDEVGFLNAHGTGTPLNDAAEWAAMVRVFGDRAGAIAVTATKGVTGHLLGSAGAIEALATVLCLAHGVVHPTPGGGAVDPGAPVRLVLHEPAPLPPGVAVSTSLAFGGSNAAAVFAPVPRAR